MSDTQTSLITGGNAGIGRLAAERLAGLGHRVVILARDQARGEKAVDEIRRSTQRDDVHLVHADLASLASVRRGAEDFLNRFDRLDLLLNNAAMSAWGMEGRQATEDGLEKMFAINYVGPWLLTRMLQSRIRESAPARIIMIGARQMGGHIEFDDLQLQRRWTPTEATFGPKRCVFCFATELARRLKDDDVTVNVLDPGLVNTGYQANAGFGLKVALKVVGKSAERVADEYVELATGERFAGETGKLFSAGEEVKLKGDPTDPAVCARLWDVTARLARFET